MRGIFFDEDDARAAALVLARGGFEATVTRERLAGEDDDEDHPWAVVTDAPMIQLEMLVETYDGWLDLDEEEPEHRPPLRLPMPLPEEPKRIKRPE
ncbi:hypothetical protein [Nocardioides stalactiti]|uniref:hypothetical protein n=1 Tax=Nocardioides stalactiti TaxID=2755356 RepID=UPI0028A9134E|nr:hypothetical protein [Nocardioides stalactiti]